MEAARPKSDEANPSAIVFGSDIETLRQRILELASTFPLAYWREKDERAEYPWEFVRAFGRHGWLGCIVPQEYGGSGLGIMEGAVLLGSVCESGAGTSGAAALHFFVFPVIPIVRYGSDHMKRQYLPRIASGELLTAFGVTEPNAGSDTSRIETTAVRNGHGWVVNGQKIWMTNAVNAQRMLLLARTSPRDPEHPFAGMTLFFTALNREACTVRTIPKLGRAAVDSNEVFIKDLRISDEDVVGKVGKGFQHLLDSLNPERVLIAMEAVGIGRAAVKLAVQYAKDRIVFDRPIGKNQAIAHPLAAATVELDAAELMAAKAAVLFDRGEPCGNEATAAKYLAAEAGFRACDAALQTFGGFGYAKEYHVERLWREMRLYRLAPLTQEMALNYIAHHALGLPRSY
jgi:acyl-CoA dehydrogenase